MKQVFTLLTLLLLIIRIGTAQTIIGPRAGFNLSGINGLDNHRIRAGGVIGAFLMYNKPSSRLGLNTDILISSRGGRSYNIINSNSGSEVWDSYYNINYLEIPALANVFFCKKSSVFRPRVFAGPSLALKINATENLKYDKYELTGEDHINLSNKTSSHYKNLDIGMILGVGFTYCMAERTYLNFDVRYLKGLTDIRDQSQIYSSPLFNQSFSILLGIGYQIGR